MLNFRGIADSGASLCILGDFNLSQFNWDLFLYPDIICIVLLLLLSAISLTQLADEPTQDDNILYNNN